MEVRIRPAGIEDVPVLLEQRQCVLREMGCGGGPAMQQMLEAAEPFLRATLADGSYRAWLAEAGGRIVGGGAVHVIPWLPSCSDASAWRAYVHSVYTEPECRRRGIARKLMEAMTAWCRERGFRSVTLHPSAAGRPLYEGMGFAPIQEMRLTL